MTTTNQSHDQLRPIYSLDKLSCRWHSLEDRNLCMNYHWRSALRYNYEPTHYITSTACNGLPGYLETSLLVALVVDDNAPAHGKSAQTNLLPGPPPTKRSDLQQTKKQKDKTTFSTDIPALSVPEDPMATAFPLHATHGLAAARETTDYPANETRGRIKRSCIISAAAVAEWLARVPTHVGNGFGLPDGEEEMFEVGEVKGVMAFVVPLLGWPVGRGYWRRREGLRRVDGGDEDWGVFERERRERVEMERGARVEMVRGMEMSMVETKEKRETLVREGRLVGVRRRVEVFRKWVVGRK